MWQKEQPMIAPPPNDEHPELQPLPTFWGFVIEIFKKSLTDICISYPWIHQGNDHHCDDEDYRYSQVHSY